MPNPEIGRCETEDDAEIADDCPTRAFAIASNRIQDQRAKPIEIVAFQACGPALKHLGTQTKS